MSTVLPNGVVIVDGADSGSTLGLAYGSSVDALIGGITESRQLQTFSWVNAAARTAQTGMMAGDFGYQVDTKVPYQYDGTSWNPLVPNSTIAQEDVSAESSFVIDGLTGYRQYEVILDLPTSSTGNSLSAQLRNNGVTDTTSAYRRIRLSGSGSAASAATSAVATSWSGLTFNNVTDKYLRFVITGLNESQRTAADLTAIGMDTSSGEVISHMALLHKVDSPFNGIEFTVSSGTVTGSYTVRGL